MRKRYSPSPVVPTPRAGPDELPEVDRLARDGVRDDGPLAEGGALGGGPAGRVAHRRRGQDRRRRRRRARHEKQLGVSAGPEMADRMAIGTGGRGRSCLRARKYDLAKWDISM